MRLCACRSPSAGGTAPRTPEEPCAGDAAKNAMKMKTDTSKKYSHKEGSFDVFNETWQNVLVVDWRAMPRLLQAKGKVIPLLLVHNFQERL